MLVVLIPVQDDSAPLHFPSLIHLLTVEPATLDSSLQENLHSVPLIISVSPVLHPRSTALVGNGHVTAKKRYKNKIGRGVLVTSTPRSSRKTHFKLLHVLV